MTKTAAAVAAVALALAQGSASEFVELDIVALDRQGVPVPNLTQSDFEIKDGGARVAIRTFAEVRARGIGQDEERSVVLLMDDVSVPNGGTTPMRMIARVLLAPTRAADEIAVVRLSHERDEAFGDVESARDRIDEYRGGALPYSPRDTPESMLRATARVASQLEPIEHRRKAIVCVGLTVVCDVPAPVAASTESFRRSWAAAVSAAARANASVYMVDPTGLTQRGGVASGAGLVGATGGAAIRNSNDFGAAAERIWREASDYYLLGYWGDSATRRPRAIDVHTDRRDVRLQARQLR